MLLVLSLTLGSSILSPKTKMQTRRRRCKVASCRAATELSCERPVEPRVQEYGRLRAFGGLGYELGVC